MDRKTFIKSCGLLCLGGPFLGSVQGCGTTKNFTVEIEESNMLVPLSFFEIKKDGETRYKKYIVVHNDLLQYPICVYRFSADSYTALWMKCTHQGAELQVFGEQLQCPAHGSEFNNVGEVQNGPADKKLRTFPVVVDNRQLKISLK